MSFLQPLMLLGLLGALVPIIIHLIQRRRPRRQPFAAIEFVLKSVERVERRWRLRRFLLLAARVAVISALALAAARPLIGEHSATTAAARGPEQVAIVIDTTLSMRARFGTDQSAFDRARALARDRIRRLGPEDRAILVAADSEPRLLVPKPTASPSELALALDRLKPGWGHGELSDAITVAARGLASANAGSANADSAGETGSPETAPAPRGARIVVLSDLAGHGIRSAADLQASGGGETAALELIDVAASVRPDARRNRGLTEIEVVNAPGQAPRTVDARVKIRAFGLEGDRDRGPAASDISLRGEDGSELYAGSVDIPAVGTIDKTLTHAFPEPGFIPVSVALEPDALAEDDVRYAIADVRHSVRALIVDGEPSGLPKEDEIFYLEAALAAGARDQPTPRVITADDLGHEDLSGVYEVVILAGVSAFTPSDGPRLVAFVEGGGGLLISGTHSLDVDLYNAELGRVLPRKLRGLKSLGDAAGGGIPVGFAEPKLDHPVMSIFGADALPGLLSANTRAYLLLEPERQKEAVVLLNYEDGQPALIEGEAGRGRVAILTTSIDRDLTDLPIRPAFLPLMRRLLLHLGGALASPAPRQVLVGEPRTISVPSGVTQLEVLGPDGKTTRLERELVGQHEIRFDDTRVPGRYAVRSAQSVGGDPEDFVVNVDPRESDLRPLRTDEAMAVLTGAQRPAEEGRDLAAIASSHFANPERVAAVLLAAMLLAFLLESLLIARRPGH
ncbi:MAG: VWA domain-containing protein [Deltaproteobacteria bacterium]|nr:VWA domain-containing protein [Deltaproteobacteria bacterium]